jgi:hypothetical protein
VTTPDLSPICDALAAAAPPGAAGADAPRDPQREADARYLKAAVKRLGREAALKVARAMGWSSEEFEALIARKPKPKPAAEAEAPDESAARDEPATPDAPPSGESEAEGWRLKKHPLKPLPPDSPVRPLGTKNGVYFFLDPANQLRDLKQKDFSAGGIRDLFGREIEYLWKTWPKFKEDGNQSGWKADACSESLIDAAARKGVFDGFAKVRGLGAWPSADGSLIYHAGDAVLIAGEWRPPGEYDGFVYPPAERSPRPAERAEGAREQAEELLKILDTFSWRGEAGREPPRVGGYRVESLIALGWIASAIVGGALEWRAMMWATGDLGSGKSALLDLARDVIGDLVKAGNATQAGVWTVLGASTRPVLLDETENDPRSPRAIRLVELARQAASGDMILRGSADHKAAAFTARSSFLFSSIIIPPMLGQDVSRFAVLELERREDSKKLRLDAVKNAAIGRAIRRRLIDGWPHWTQRFDRWREGLAAIGHDARGCDQWGTLLAMADLTLHDEPPDSDSLAELCALFPAAKSERQSNAEDMLGHLTTVPVDAFRGGNRVNIGELAARAALQEWGDERDAEGEEATTNERTPKKCREALRTWGVFVDRETGDPIWRVALPNKHEGLRRLFEGTQWRSDPGAGGGWAQAMKRLPGARAENSRKLGGRGWSVPIGVFLMKEEG